MELLANLNSQNLKIAMNRIGVIIRLRTNWQNE
jgi:hypothetical protein